MELAQAKAQMHETMELKDNELQEIRTSSQTLKEQNEELNEKVKKLEQTGRQLHFETCPIESRPFGPITSAYIKSHRWIRGDFEAKMVILLQVSSYRFS